MNKKLQAILNVALVIIIIPLIFSIFVDSPYILTIDQFLGQENVYDNESDCITFLNADEGDAILIRSNGRFVLIDTGDGAALDIVKALKKNGVNGIDALILTHWHDDHIGGAVDVLENFPVLNVVMPRFPDSVDELYGAACTVNDAAEKAGVRFAVSAQGLAVNCGDFRLTCLYYDPNGDGENNRSAIYMAKCRNKKFLLMADGEIPLENKLLNESLNLDCDVIKIGHHGSNTSTSLDLLNAATPEYAVISVGRKNLYGHPSSEVVSLLNKNDIKVYRTDLCGEIDIYVLENELDVKMQLVR
ncbi:MAG: MBL fold metallo-hydrolase [Clostridia bacterium]|nr:MBL fold metallo-hydrolase [Clostridia bacterium]